MPTSELEKAKNAIIGNILGTADKPKKIKLLFYKDLTN
jgi:hypothetical protein